MAAAENSIVVAVGIQTLNLKEKTVILKENNLKFPF
jgi:hypothetical protein